MAEAKVISCIFGGLGDWLLLSTLPRRFTEQGYEVYIHDGPLTQIRNAGQRALILANPYIKGFLKHPPNAGHGVYADLWGMYSALARHRSERNCIALMEELHGLPPPYSDLPEVYLETEPGPKRDDLCIVYPFSQSVPFTRDSVDPWIDYFKPQFKDKQFLVVEPPGYASFHRSMFGHQKMVLTQGDSVQSMKESLALMRAAHAVFTIETGDNMLAGAVKRERPDLKVFSLFSTRGYNQKFYTLSDKHVNYSVSAFVLQNDFAVDPGELCYYHRVETAAFADKARAGEAEAANVLTAAKVLAGHGMRQPGEIVEGELIGTPDPADPGFPIQPVHENGNGAVRVPV